MTYQELLQEFSWAPAVKGTAPRAKDVIVGGMGGSALPAHAARFLDNSLSIATHRDYDLPESAPEDALYVAISHSGNTEETLSFASAVLERKLPLAAIAAGGKLLAFAKDNDIPYVEVPGDAQPRNSLFYLVRALAALIGRNDLGDTLTSVSFDADAAAADAAALAKTLAGALPLFYASRTNGFLSYVSKIHFNETAKMPAYANVFPELNHNEMQSFDSPAPGAVTDVARFVILRDPEDNPRVARRMDVFAELMRERGRNVTEFELVGETRAEKLARAWFVMHTAARTSAEARDVDPDSVPLVEDFKKRL